KKTMHSRRPEPRKPIIWNSFSSSAPFGRRKTARGAGKGPVLVPWPPGLGNRMDDVRFLAIRRQIDGYGAFSGQIPPGEHNRAGSGSTGMLDSGVLHDDKHRLGTMRRNGISFLGMDDE